MAVNNQKGFTLIEMMMALVIGAMITAATYATYSSQQKAYQTQDQVAEMQQNLRAALYLIIEEIQMAGYDPEDSGNFSVTSAMPGRIQFETDKDEDGDSADEDNVNDSKETIDLGLSRTFDANGDGIPDTDSDGDGVPDPVDIGIQTGGAGGFQDIAENIQAVEFLYLDSAGINLALAPPVDLSAIRSVQITILAIAERSDPKFINSMTYTTPSGQNWGPYNDNFRRRLLTTTIKCRNLGI
ncbi:prepilin-type N-terminal cleavage/methylation domain-containing protein [Desulfobacter postgatei]|uniref:Prepilin-type N-terminal cleavage/methylation domain-containing protein n=1 Tax=Desulfobacter postgatei 2ac9 TaxID=879212 RepID=I5B0T8_9BACT|nr:prepilin-type N-terminal cleavage/methylation domain-containing protein [Desulfobacter postgatei]EIM63101.1 prepilin-type N-terminal cleavage/methylation domain-containing protein [Desulfobacter postgatei 2ac9]